MSSTQLRAFKPYGANVTVNAAVTTSSAALAFGSGGSIGTKSVRIANVGSNTIFITFGTGSATAATTTSLPMLGNTVEVFTVNADNTHVAHISGAAGNTIYVTVGEGL